MSGDLCRKVALFEKHLDSCAVCRNRLGRFVQQDTTKALAEAVQQLLIALDSRDLIDTRRRRRVEGVLREVAQDLETEVEV